jgi:flagellar hook protein FlgE
VDTVDLSDSMVAMLTARQEFTANLNAFKTADEIQRQTIDLLA